MPAQGILPQFSVITDSLAVFNFTAADLKKAEGFTTTLNGHDMRPAGEHTFRYLCTVIRTVKESFLFLVLIA